MAIYLHPLERHEDAVHGARTIRAHDTHRNADRYTIFVVARTERLRRPVFGHRTRQLWVISVADSARPAEPLAQQRLAARPSWKTMRRWAEEVLTARAAAKPPVY